MTSYISRDRTITDQEEQRKRVIEQKEKLRQTHQRDVPCMIVYNYKHNQAYTQYSTPYT